MSFQPTNSSIISQQISSLDSSDPYALTWQSQVLSQITNQSSLKQQSILWGGRGKGGRGMSRQTVQPKDVIINDITLEYCSEDISGCVGSKVLLKDAKLKLLGTGILTSSSDDDGDDNDDGLKKKGRVYALVGRNGCGKSTLLRRIDAKKIPGVFNLHLKSMYIPQEVFEDDYNFLNYNDDDDDNGDDDDDGDECRSTPRQTHNDIVTPLDIVLGYKRKNKKESKQSSEKRIQELEEELEIIMEKMNNSDVNYDHEMERICTEIAYLEDLLNGTGSASDNMIGDKVNDVEDEEYHKASQVLDYFGIDEDKQHSSMNILSGGQKKKVLLACALFCDIDILLLDEPTNHLDIQGIIQLHGLIQTMAERQTITVLVSHDVDLINSVATDVIHFSNQTLTYYRGNYIDFQLQKNEHERHKIHQQQTLDKQRSAMIKTIDNLQKQSTSVNSKGGNSKKISRAVNNRKKKLERHGIEKNELGHRWTAQNACTGMKIGSINSLDASTRKQSKNYSQLLKRSDLRVTPVPEKEVQFKFRNTTCRWHEPLISAIDVGHGFEDEGSETMNMLFDGVDLSVDEQSVTCILGENQCGKTTLLKILSDQLSPTQGKVTFAQNVNISYFDQHKADNLIVDACNKYGSTTSSISLLMSIYPKKTEQDVRGELTSFGLSPQQASTYIQFLSGGERCRLCLAMLMLSDPHILILDEPSNHLDPESVDALAYGIKHWNGTVLLVSHDVYLVHQLEAKCYVLMNEGKLKYVQGGIDSYLRSVSLQESKKLTLA